MRTTEIRNVVKRGGSLTLNIPAKLAKKMGLFAGCPVILRLDEKGNSLVIERVRSIETQVGTVIDIEVGR